MLGLGDSSSHVVLYWRAGVERARSACVSKTCSRPNNRMRRVFPLSIATSPSTQPAAPPGLDSEPPPLSSAAQSHRAMTPQSRRWRAASTLHRRRGWPRCCCCEMPPQRGAARMAPLLGPPLRSPPAAAAAPPPHPLRAAPPAPGAVRCAAVRPGWGKGWGRRRVDPDAYSSELARRQRAAAAAARCRLLAVSRASLNHLGLHPGYRIALLCHVIVHLGWLT